MMRAKVTVFLLLLTTYSWSQTFPGEGDNIDYLITSGGAAPIQVGDDDHQQVVFFLIPKNQTSPFYIRVYDPGVGGALDEIQDSLNTKMTYSIYGGKGTFSDSLSTSIKYQMKPKGTLLKKRTFGSELTYDKKWFSFGPFNPKKGEFNEAFGGYIFKVIVSGKKGNDVNLYKLSLSSSKTSNVAISGGNLFTYEYSFRLKSEKGSIGHVYPYMDDKIVSIKQFNFDLDNDVNLRLFSVVKKGEIAATSGNGNWKHSKHQIDEREKGKCIDMQIKKVASWHNDVVIYVLNQYDEAVPFFAAPIGDISPKFSFKSGK